mmetsp:Transcript_9512/g.21135  ORF Transcript_9512/g.21135 Transcript_9512/m.21135 type:complete len:306 (+) Transcript_9512:2138-3055(+)
MLKPPHPFSEDWSYLETWHRKLPTDVDNVSLEELLQIRQDRWVFDAAISLQKATESHSMDHSRMQTIGNAKLQCQVHIKLPCDRTHHYTRHAAEVLRERICKVLNDKRLRRRRLCTRDIRIASTLGGDSVDHRVVEADALLEPALEGLRLLSSLRVVAAEDMVSHSSSIERHVVCVDDAQLVLLAVSRGEARIEELCEVLYGLPVVCDAGLSEPKANEAQLRQFGRQLHESAAASRLAKSPSGHQWVALRDDFAIHQDSVHLIGELRALLHVLDEALPTRLRQDHIATQLQHSWHQHSAQKTACA